MKKIIIASVLGIAVILSGCGGGGDDATAFVPQEFYTISGKISNLNDTGETGVSSFHAPLDSGKRTQDFCPNESGPTGT